MKQSEEKAKSGSYRKILNEIFDGTVLTKGFITRNYLMMIIIIVGIFFYIGNHYSVIMNLNRIDKLQIELADIKNEALTQSSLLMKESRQSRVKELVKKKEIGLEESLTPPFEIEIK